jgi:hypothetical protein
MTPDQVPATSAWAGRSGAVRSRSDTPSSSCPLPR